MKRVDLSDLRASIDVTSTVEGTPNAVTRVVAARTFDEITRAPQGSVVVLDPLLARELRGYRFDIALGGAAAGLVAILVHADAPVVPSLTARRIAAERGIALGRLRDGQDVVSLAIQVHDLIVTGGQTDVVSLQRVCDLSDGCVESSAIPLLLRQCSHELGVKLEMLDGADSANAVPIQVQGIVRHHLAYGGDQVLPVVRTAAAYLARRIEALLQADYEAHELPATTRTELLNEILLSDTATSADAISRLRQADFPIDGSHYAIRVDCHDPLPQPASLQAVNRCQQRLAEILLDGMKRASGEWTRAGTLNSIVLISSRDRAHTDLVATESTKLIGAAMGRARDRFPGLRIHIGVGTPHLSAGGLRTSVTEATTAVRVARARGIANEIQHFDRLGLGRALVRWAEIDGVRPIINEIMAPLLNQSARQTREALNTLRAYLDSGQSITKTAELLHLHRNTVRYRLERIAALLPVDMTNPDDRLLLELSCRVIDAELR
ncbi:MAG: helix-turn-helix domain-containing protein [Acidimicrobiia bacterium]|nr:helix-turn-helix domain-containing protein [Acidimicrobiia bacterium]